MTITTTPWIALDDASFCSFEELLALSGLTALELSELVDIGIIVAHDNIAAPVFALRYVTIAGTARRLRDDFELDHHGMALAIKLLGQIEVLERQLALLNAHASA